MKQKVNLVIYEKVLATIAGALGGIDSVYQIIKMYINPILGGKLVMKGTSATLSKLVGKPINILGCNRKKNKVDSYMACVNKEKDEVAAALQNSSPEIKQAYSWLDPSSLAASIKGKMNTNGGPDQIFRGLYWSKETADKHMWQMFYIIAAEFCAQPGGSMALCKPSLRKQYANNAGLFKGDEQMPYSRFVVQRLEPGTEDPSKVQCEIEVYWHMLLCTTCCCANGLVMADKRLMMTTAKHAMCGEWFGWVDILIEILMGILRVTQSSSQMRDYSRLCVPKWG